MAKDDDWTNLLREVAADTATVAPGAKDMGPSARRAAAGMPPPPIATDPSPSPMDYGKDLLGRPRAQPSKLGNTHDPMETDAGAQMIAGGLMGYGAGQLVPAAPAGASFFAKALSRVTGGAAEGAVASKTQGGRADVGAALGGGLAGAGVALERAGVAPASAANQAAADKDLYREIGRAATGKAQEKVAGLGADQIVKTARDIGFANTKSWTERAAAASAAKQQAGEQIGAVFKQLDASGAARPTTSVVQALENLKGELGKTTEGQKLADIVTSKQQELISKYGGGDALDKASGRMPGTIPASALNKEIGDLQAIGYSGGGAGQLSPAAAKRVARLSAKAMDDELNTALAAARKDPGLAKAVQSLDDLNPRYRSLIAIDTIARRQASKEPFGPTAGENLAKTLRTGKADLAINAATAPVRAGLRAADALAGGVPGGAPGAAARPERKVAPAVVPIVQSLSEHNGADLSKHVEQAVFGP